MIEWAECAFNGSRISCVCISKEGLSLCEEQQQL